MAESNPIQDDKERAAYPVSADCYEVICEIGSGAFATVFRAIVKGRDEAVAIKVVDLDQFNTNWEEIRKEISTMSLLQHANVVKIHTSFVEGQDLWIVMPLLAGGSCASIMKQICPTGFKDEVLIATILQETLRGLQYFHKDGRIHRDIKAGNILISEKGDVQLADFGVAGTLMENGDRKKIRQTFTGTPCWMAPEVMEQTNGYDYKADIWSFGITAMELGYGSAPYAKYQPMKVLLLTLQQDPPTCDIYKDNSFKFSKDFHSLISKCLRKDATKRPNATKLLTHKFFKRAQNSAYIIDKIIKRIPPLPTESVNLDPKALGVYHKQIATTEKNKPISVGSWRFDKEELNQMKKQLEEEKKAEAGAAKVQSAKGAPRSPDPVQVPARVQGQVQAGQPNTNAPSQPVQVGRFEVSDE